MSAPGGGRPDILQRIIAAKRGELERARAVRPLAEVQAAARAIAAPRDFAGALRARIDAGRAAVIAEIKRASPSRGILRAEFDPPAIARSYAAHGAACLSVLTDTEFFQGRPEDLVGARSACALPALRKDFVVDAYQVWESRAMGADCVLLIVAALDPGALSGLASIAASLGMAVLVEVHDRQELERALELPAELIGINNRDLRTFETRLETTLELLGSIPAGRLVVTESGISSAADIARMRAAGVHAFLVGEALMREKNPGKALADLFASG